MKINQEKNDGPRRNEVEDSMRRTTKARKCLDIGEGLANIQINTDTEVIIKPQVVVTANFKPILCISLALAISSIPIANMTSTTLLPLLQ